MRGIHLNMLSPVRIHEARRTQEGVESLRGRLGNNCAENTDNPESCIEYDDEIDRPDESASVTRWDIIFLSFSIVTHIFDIGADINLAVRYLIWAKYMYFALTIVFIFFPTFVNTFISFRMNYQDRQLGLIPVKEDGAQGGMITATTRAARRKTWCILVVLFQFAPVLRYWDSLRYAMKARRCKKAGDLVGQRRYYLKMIKEDQNVALLRVFECFLEAAPQQILQLTILIKDHNLPKPESDFKFQILQIGSVCSSLVSMGWSMASYHRTIRLAQHDKPNIDLIGTILQFLWHFCVTVSRIVSISVVASMQPEYTGLACACHWAIMTTWLVTEPGGAAQFCRDVNNSPLSPLTVLERIRSALFAAVLGTVYVFTYLNPTDGHTFVRHLFYYTLCLVENGAATASWAMADNQNLRDSWYFAFFIVLCTVPFCIGIAAMIFYYVFFHPTTKRKNSPPEQVTAVS